MLSPVTSPPSTSKSLSSTATPQAAPLPPPDALAGVLYRLADAAVPGPQKLNLVEGATPENAGVFDQFSNALLQRWLHTGEVRYTRRRMV